MDLAQLGLTSILIFLVPGYISNRTYRSIYTVKSDSEWAQAANGLVSSLWILALINACESCLGTEVFKIEKLDQIPSFKIISLLIVMGYIWGYIRAFIHWLKFYLSRKWPNQFSLLYPDPGAVWPIVNQRKNETEWAKVTLTDNSSYLGWISNWHFDPDREDYDFLLADAIRLEDAENGSYEVTGAGVYISSKNVFKIEFFKQVNQETEPIPEVAST